MQTETSLHFTADHPAFAGHFPGHPMVPGALLLDAVLHAIAEAAASGSSTLPAGLQPQVSPTVWQIGSAKFLSPVRPGETLTLSWQSADTGGARFAIRCGVRQIASGTLSAGVSA